MAAWKLADKTRSIIDSSFDDLNRAAMQTLQRYGKVSATYGEIANRSDVIVCWDCDLQRQPCLLKMLTAKKVPGRKFVFVGDGNSPMAEQADHVFAVDSNQDRTAMVRLICRLRAKTANKELTGDRCGDCDLPLAKVQELFDLLAAANYVSLFYDCYETDWEFDFETESLLRLVTEFNSIAPMVGVKVRHDQNGLGAETILTLASGFPNAISLQRGYAESTGAIYTVTEALRRAACDTILLFGNVNRNRSDPMADSIQSELERTTVIQLARRSDSFADLFIRCPVVEAGSSLTGEVLRDDGALLSGNVPAAGHSAESILESLADAFQKASPE